jgi:tetratricopeptide (TPR) repeat protein
VHPLPRFDPGIYADGLSAHVATGRRNERAQTAGLKTLAYADAVAALDEALQLLVEAGDRHREGAVLVNLGSLHREAGVVEEARSCWSKALERLDPDSPESQQTERLLRAS